MNGRGLTLRDGRRRPDGQGQGANVGRRHRPGRSRRRSGEVVPHARSDRERRRAIIGPDTVVMSLQNGLGHEEILAEVVGKDRVLAGKTYAGGVLLGPGHVIAGTKGKYTYHRRARRPHHRARDDGSPRRSPGPGSPTEVSANIMGTMWDKLLINVATGALSGITRLPYGGLYSVPEVKTVRARRGRRRDRGRQGARREAHERRAGRRVEARRRGAAQGIQDVDAAEHRKGRADGDRFHQRLGRALGRAGEGPDAGQPGAGRLRQGHRAVA